MLRFASGLVLGAFVVLHVPQAAAQTKLYWTDPNLGIIKRCNLDGSTVETVLNTGEDIAYLTAANSLGRIYYSIGSPVPQLWSADFAGQNRQLLDTFDTANYTRALAFNPADSKLYWSSSHGYVAGNGKIRSANNNGSNVTDILTLSERYPYGLAIDPTAGKMYWIDSADEKRIERANLDGTARETVINGSVGFTGQIALDPIGQKLYWVDSEHGLVERANLNGTAIQTIGTFSSGGESGIAVDGVAGKVFWSDTNLDRIYSANLDGSGPTVIVTTALSYPFSLAIVSVPEPSALVLGAAALAALCLIVQSRKPGANL